MKINYITIDKLDIGNFSGTGYYIPKFLERKPGVDLSNTDALINERRLPMKVLEKYYKYVHNKKYISRVNPRVLRGYGNQIAGRVPVDTDILVSSSSRPFALMGSKKPMVFWTDAVFAGMVDFYPEFSNLADITIRQGNQMEQEALHRCRLAVYSSEWAAETAKKYYQVDNSRVAVVNYGANIENDLNLEEVKELIKRKPSDQCNLLFIGVHWKRKGGNKALETAHFLNRHGLKTQLSIVGVEPPPGNYPDYVKTYGFISKGSGEGREKLRKLIEESHFLILPTIADCTPIVFAEFNSYGIPVLTTNVGGIPSVISDGVNGYKHGLHYEAEDYAKVITGLFDDFRRYKELCLSSYNEYKTRLNWETATDKFHNLLKECI